jgi:hypothetical protein
MTCYNKTTKVVVVVVVMVVATAISLSTATPHANLQRHTDTATWIDRRTGAQAHRRTGARARTDKLNPSRQRET